MGLLSFLLGTRRGVQCAVCGQRPDPHTIHMYNPNQPLTITSKVEFGKCPKCKKIFCGKCKKKVWLDSAHTMNFGSCPNDYTGLEIESLYDDMMRERGIR